MKKRDKKHSILPLYTFLYPFVLLAGLVLLSGGSVQAAGVTIVYSNDIRGEIEPCG